MTGLSAILSKNSESDSSLEDDFRLGFKVFAVLETTTPHHDPLRVIHDMLPSLDGPK